MIINGISTRAAYAPRKVEESNGIKKPYLSDKAPKTLRECVESASENPHDLDFLLDMQAVIMGVEKPSSAVRISVNYVNKLIEAAKANA